MFRTSFGWENTHTPIQRQWSDGESCPLHTLFTPHSTLQTLDSPVPLQSTLHPEAVYTPYSTLYFTTPHSKVCTLHFTLYTLHFKLSTPHSTQKTLFSTLHSPKSTMVGDRERIYNTLVTNCLVFQSVLVMCIQVRNSSISVLVFLLAFQKNDLELVILKLGTIHHFTILLSNMTTWMILITLGHLKKPCIWPQEWHLCLMVPPSN